MFVLYCLRRQTFGDERVAEAARATGRYASQQQARAAAGGANQLLARAAEEAAQREHPRVSAAGVRYG